MSILALDLGTTTGWACSMDRHCSVLSGTWSFKPLRFEGGGMRYVHFRERLNEFLYRPPLSTIYFEEVRRHAGTTAAHVYGGFMATLEAWCEERKIPYQGVPVGAIKKYWTGKGNASKEDMIESARMRGFDPVDDNEADALAILHMKRVVHV